MRTRQQILADIHAATRSARELGADLSETIRAGRTPDDRTDPDDDPDDVPDSPDDDTDKCECPCSACLAGRCANCVKSPCDEPACNHRSGDDDDSPGDDDD
jgi:hypothetical protein